MKFILNILYKKKVIFHPLIKFMTLSYKEQSLIKKAKVLKIDIPDKIEQLPGDEIDR